MPLDLDKYKKHDVYWRSHGCIVITPHPYDPCRCECGETPTKEDRIYGDDKNEVVLETDRSEDLLLAVVGVALVSALIRPGNRTGKVIEALVKRFS